MLGLKHLIRRSDLEHVQRWFSSRRTIMIYFALVFTLLFFLTISAGSAQQTVFVSIIKDGSAENSVSVQGYMPIVKSSLPPAQPPGVGPIWGVNFISSAEDRADDQQYQNGIATGASMAFILVQYRDKSECVRLVETG